MTIYALLVYSTLNDIWSTATLYKILSPTHPQITVSYSLWPNLGVLLLAPHVHLWRRIDMGIFWGLVLLFSIYKPISRNPL